MSICSPKILITGANGQVGQAIQANFQNKGISHIACTRTQLDVSNLKALKEVFKEHKPKVIINTAAYTAVDQAETDKISAIKTNHLATELLGQLCEEHQVRLIHLSTDYVFNGSKTAPYTEADSPDPLNVYGESKLLGEEAIKQVCEDHVILRVSAIFSSYQRNFLKTMLALGLERRELNIVSDQVTCPTYANDIATTITHVINNPELKGLFHFCNNNSTSWYEFAKCIFESAKNSYTFQLNKLNPIPAKAYPTQALRPAYSVLSTEKIISTLKIKIPHWQEGIHACIKQLNQQTG